MTVRVDRYRCGYCGACVGVCPNVAIELVETWIAVNDELCESCSICVKICPIGALEVVGG
ncbi:4Fe-4S binding domain protein [Candidatus Methanoperedenaceae archaeon GB50]|nr:4Fe-4S binding domain protein [Candidatus Methanoperedenaceae archaeon GB37]CAD7769278.1 4Fe-4S binding domain protein [Candidatus Methanoperedenaceae archaeon GB50]CAD7773248.1 MAG: 4Fe-4S binding domain protein [Candidatus Methanoperedenaceae archaeon GB50]